MTLLIDGLITAIVVVGFFGLMVLIGVAVAAIWASITGESL